MNNNFEKDYLDFRTEQTPELWDRIEAEIDSADLNKSPVKKKTFKRIVSLLVAAAAVVVLGFAFNTDVFHNLVSVVNGRNTGVSDSEDASRLDSANYKYSLNGSYEVKDNTSTTMAQTSETTTTTVPETVQETGSVDKVVL